MCLSIRLVRSQSHVNLPNLGMEIPQLHRETRRVLRDRKRKRNQIPGHLRRRGKQRERVYTKSCRILNPVCSTECGAILRYWFRPTASACPVLLTPPRSIAGAYVYSSIYISRLPTNTPPRLSWTREWGREQKETKRMERVIYDKYDGLWNKIQCF